MIRRWAVRSNYDECSFFPIRPMTKGAAGLENRPMIHKRSSIMARSLRMMLEAEGEPYRWWTNLEPSPTSITLPLKGTMRTTMAAAFRPSSGTTDNFS